MGMLSMEVDDCFLNISEGQLAVLKFLLKSTNADPDERNAYSVTPVQSAIKRKQAEALELILVNSKATVTQNDVYVVYTCTIIFISSQLTAFDVSLAAPFMTASPLPRLCR